MQKVSSTIIDLRCIKECANYGMCESELGWSIFYSIQDNKMKRCQGLTIDKMNQVDKTFSSIIHVTINDIKFP